MSSTSKSGWRFLLASILWCAALGAHADADDPPTRVARLAYLDGGVSFRPAGAEDWIEAGLNRPLTIGDQLWSDRDGRMEVQLDGSNLRLGTETSAGILNLTDQSTQIQLSSGTLIVHVRQLADDESYEIDTPTVAFSILRAGTYRLTVDPNGNSTTIAVRSGQGEAVGTDGTGYTVRAGEYDTFAGLDQVDASSAPLGPQDEFDAWSAARDGRFDRSQSAQYVSPDVVGYEALDNQGDWNDTPEYGHVWFPSGVDVGWAPYHRGHWAYVAPWGYTWIDDRPWGFAPFHYGRWVYWRQRWGWVPVAPPAPRMVYVRPVYAPALVAWVGGGATVGWFPLGPREVYVPSYPVSRRYLNVVNVSNTRIDTTVINNVYNTTIVNRTTVNNITYANRRVPGAVMATNAQDFASARPVRRDGGGEARNLANGPVRAFAPAVVPTRAAVYGGRAAASLRPSQAVQTRVTAARMAPAAGGPSVDARLQALRDSGGRAPDAAQLARAAAQPSRAPPVRVVPPVRTLVSSKDFAAARTQGAPAAAIGSARHPAGGRDPVSPRAAPSAGATPERAPTQPTAPRQDAFQRTQPTPRPEGQVADPRRQPLDAQQSAQRQAQSQAQAELARRQQLDQQRNAQLEQVQAQQRAQADSQARMQQQAQAEQQRATQLDRQRQAEQQVQQQRAAQLAQQQEQQRAQAETQARAQQQAQAQAEQQRGQQQQLERQREAGQAQYQRQQQALEAQRQTRDRQEQQQQQQAQQQQQQQTRARENQQDRQQAVQRQVEQQRRPTPPPQNPPR